MQSIFLGYLQANLNQSLKLPVTQFMVFKPMPKICVSKHCVYSTHGQQQGESPEISHSGSKEKHMNK
jgi:hypothetical protein